MAQKMGITSNPPAPSGRFPWTAVISIMLVVLFAGGIIVASLHQTLWESPIVPQPSSGIVAVEPTATPMPKPTPSPSKVLGPTIMGGILLSDKGKHFSYGLGYWFVPPGSADYPRYDFPIAITTSSPGEGGWRIIAEIADPDLRQIGEEWKFTVEDPGRDGFILEVKLTRVDKDYKYKSAFTLSPDKGKSWFRPLGYPVELPPGS